jgi:hypothetical protein
LELWLFAGVEMIVALRFRAEILHFTEANYSTCLGAAIFEYIGDGPGLEYTGSWYDSVLLSKSSKNQVHTFQQENSLLNGCGSAYAMLKISMSYEEQEA